MNFDKLFVIFFTYIDLGLNEPISFLINFEQLLPSMYLKIDFFFYILHINSENLINFCVHVCFDVYKI